MKRFYVFAVNNPARITKMLNAGQTVMTVVPNVGMGADVKIDGQTIGHVLQKNEAEMEYKAVVDSVLRAKKNAGECAGVNVAEYIKFFGYSEDFATETEVNILPSIRSGRMMAFMLNEEKQAVKEATVNAQNAADLSAFTEDETALVDARIQRIRAFKHDKGVTDNVCRLLVNRLARDKAEGIAISEYTPVFVEKDGASYMKALKLLLTGKPIALVGDAAVGKNTMADDIANLLNLDTFDKPCAKIPVEELKYTREIRNGDTSNRLSDFLQAVRDGRMVILDEVNGARAEVTLFLNSLLDYRKKVNIEDVGVISASPRTCFIFTMNAGDAYAGTNKTNWSTIGSRVQVIHMAYQRGTIQRVFENRGLANADATTLADYFETFRDGLNKIDNEAVATVDFRAFERIADCVMEGLYPSVRDAVKDIFVDEVSDPDVRAAIATTFTEISSTLSF